MVHLGIRFLRLLLFLGQRALNILTLGNWPSAVAACVIVTDDNGRLLLLERADGAGLGLPGGFVKLYEPLETAARREVREETGIELDNLHFVGHLSGKRMPGIACVDAIYHARVDASAREQVRSSLEGKAGWFEYEQVKDRIAYDYNDILEPFYRDFNPVQQHRR